MDLPRAGQFGQTTSDDPNPPTESQLNLGVLYASGLGIPKNYIVAYVWWSIASKQGSITAKTNREKLLQMMNTYQLETAQALEKECIENDFQGC